MSTDKAYEIGKDMDSVVESMEQRMLKPLNDSQIKQLTEMLELISKNLE